MSEELKSAIFTSIKAYMKAELDGADPNFSHVAEIAGLTQDFKRATNQRVADVLSTGGMDDGLGGFLAPQNGRRRRHADPVLAGNPLGGVGPFPDAMREALAAQQSVAEVQSENAAVKKRLKTDVIETIESLMKIERRLEEDASSASEYHASLEHRKLVKQRLAMAFAELARPDDSSAVPSTERISAIVGDDPLVGYEADAGAETRMGFPTVGGVVR